MQSYRTKRVPEKKVDVGFLMMFEELYWFFADNKVIKQYASFSRVDAEILGFLIDAENWHCGQENNTMDRNHGYFPATASFVNYKLFLSDQTVYNSYKRLEKLGIINRTKNQSETYVRLNHEALAQIKESFKLYKNKRDLIWYDVYIEDQESVKRRGEQLAEFRDKYVAECLNKITNSC